MATEGGLRLTLDIWHPDCWTLEVTDATDGGLLGHGVHTVEGRATGRFTAYADTVEGLEDLVAAIDESPHTHSVWETEEAATDGGAVPGEATRSLLVEYDLDKSINDALVSRGFIPDEPVRMVAGREYWTVLVREGRETVRERLEAVREQAEAAIADLDLDSEVEISFRESPDPGIKYDSYVTDRDHPLVGAFENATRSVAGVDPEIAYFSSVGDFNYFGDPDRADLPTLIVGPDGENIHSAGEFVYTDEVVEVARIVAEGTTRLVC